MSKKLTGAVAASAGLVVLLAVTSASADGVVARVKKNYPIDCFGTGLANQSFTFRIIDRGDTCSTLSPILAFTVPPAEIAAGVTCTQLFDGPMPGGGLRQRINANLSPLVATGVCMSAVSLPGGSNGAGSDKLLVSNGDIFPTLASGTTGVDGLPVCAQATQTSKKQFDICVNGQNLEPAGGGAPTIPLNAASTLFLATGGKDKVRKAPVLGVWGVGALGAALVAAGARVARRRRSRSPGAAPRASGA